MIGTSTVGGRRWWTCGRRRDTIWHHSLPGHTHAIASCQHTVRNLWVVLHGHYSTVIIYADGVMYSARFVGLSVCELSKSYTWILLNFFDRILRHVTLFEIFVDDLSRGVGKTGRCIDTGIPIVVLTTYTSVEVWILRVPSCCLVGNDTILNQLAIRWYVDFTCEMCFWLVEINTKKLDTHRNCFVIKMFISWIAATMHDTHAHAGLTAFLPGEPG